MPDARLEAYAKLLVERCVDVQPGWQVVVTSSPYGRPLVAEVLRAVGRRGAYGLPRISLPGVEQIWQKEAPEALLAQVAPIDAHSLEQADCLIAIEAPENTREGSDVPPERLTAIRQARRPLIEPYISDRKAWVGCQFPTPALAQDAGMTLEAFAEFLYGAVLLDWDVERKRMEKIKELFDGAKEVRIVGDGTDLRIGLEGREGKIDAAGANIPGGEVFYSPVEDTAEGVIEFSEFPAIYAGRELTDIRFLFEGGRIVEASARTNEQFLLETLDTDDGAKRLGELGIGCNPGITRYMKNTLFDEKMNGTVHLAIGRGFPDLGGTNVSAIHWDIVKDVRKGGRIELDGKVVQEAGEWLR
jgi:aminopeptidase